MRNHDTKPRYESININIRIRMAVDAYTTRNYNAIPNCLHDAKQELFKPFSFTIKFVRRLRKGNDYIKNIKQHCRDGSEKA